MQIEQWSVGKSTLRYLIPRTKENGTVHNVWKNAGMNRIAIMKASTKAKLLSPLHIKTSCVKRGLLLTPVAHIIPFQSLHI
jgi:hypothetical protein